MNRVKVTHFRALHAWMLCCVCWVVAASCSLAGEAGPKVDADIPLQIRDEAADDWVLDRFAGNTSAGAVRFQGPAVEAGGLTSGGGVYSLAAAPDGRVFIPYSAQMGGICLAEISVNGLLRQIVSPHEWAADGLEGTYERCGMIAWNPKENALYFWGKSCIRKLVEKPDGTHSIETVVGNPKKPGLEDGPVAQATLTSVGGFLINSRGDIFFLDGNPYGSCLRKLSNGVVTTLNKNFRFGKLQDGPLKDAHFAFCNVLQFNSIGENDDILYVGDHWNFAVRRIDLKTGIVSTVAKTIPKESPLAKTREHGADGPALTHATFISGNLIALYDPFHKTIWVGGPDETRLRWLRLSDGWIKTVMGFKRGKWNPEDIGAPADTVGINWIYPLTVDSKGRTYLTSSQYCGYWRLYNKKEISK